MSDAAPISTDDLAAKYAKLLNLQADTALKDAQLRHVPPNLAADTALKEAQLRLQTANLQADTALKLMNAKFEPMRIIFTAMAAGGALVGATVALTHAFGR